MYRISGTPYYEDVTSGISGETLKQLDIDLVATAGKCHISYGNGWEDVVWMAGRMEAAYGNQEDGERIIHARLNTVWKSAEIRDNNAIAANSKMTGDFITNLDTRTRLEMVAEVHGWDKAMIDKIVERIEQEAAKAAESEIGRNISPMDGGGAAFDISGGGFADTALGDPLNPGLNQTAPNTTPQAEALV
jgi:hypothetical protein